jgi:hypothetical protein
MSYDVSYFTAGRVVLPIIANGGRAYIHHLLHLTYRGSFFHLESYKMEVDDFSSFMAQEFCGVSLNICTLIALQMYSNMAFEKAVGWSCLPYMAMTVFKILTDKAATVNMPKKNSYFVLVISKTYLG